MPCCAVISAKPIVLCESKICAYLTRLFAWYDEGGGSHESQQIHLPISLCIPRLPLPWSYQISSPDSLVRNAQILLSKRTMGFA
jgi:hypothetical protein